MDRLRDDLAKARAECEAWRRMFDTMKDVKISLYDASGKQQTIGTCIAAQSCIAARAANGRGDG